MWSGYCLGKAASADINNTLLDRVILGSGVDLQKPLTTCMSHAAPCMVWHIIATRNASVKQTSDKPWIAFSLKRLCRDTWSQRSLKHGTESSIEPQWDLCITPSLPPQPTLTPSEDSSEASQRYQFTLWTCTVGMSSTCNKDTRR